MYQPALRSVIANRLGGGRQVIIEGDYVLPELGVPGDLSVTSDGRVGAVFLLENAAVQIATNFQSRRVATSPFERIRAG